MDSVSVKISRNLPTSKPWLLESFGTAYGNPTKFQTKYLEQYCKVYTVQYLPGERYTVFSRVEAMTMRPRTFFLGRCVLWTMCPLDKHPWLICPDPGPHNYNSYLGKPKLRSPYPTHVTHQVCPTSILYTPFLTYPKIKSSPLVTNESYGDETSKEKRSGTLRSKR